MTFSPIGGVAATDEPDPLERQRLRVQAQAALGITGQKTDITGLARGIRRCGVGWYPLVALSLLVMVDELQGYAFSVLGPEIAGTLGVGKTALAAIVTAKTLAIAVAMLPLAALVQNRARRGLVSIVAAFGWSVLTAATGLVTSLGALAAAMVADGATTGSVRTVHTPLIMDSYPPDIRVRGLSAYKAADGIGAILGPVFVAVMTGLLGFTWRGVFVAMGGVCLIAAIASLGLRDPGFGRWDADRARSAVRQQPKRSRIARPAAVSLGFFEIANRLLLIRTVQRVLLGLVVLGMLIVPLATYLFFFLDEEWGMGPTDRAVFAAVMPMFSLGALALFGRRGEQMFRSDPGQVLRLAGLMISLAVAAVATGVVMPVFALMVLCFGLAWGLVTALAPALGIALLSVVPPSMRPHAAALQGIAIAAMGGLLGTMLLGGLDSRFGSRVAIFALTVPGIIAGLVLRSASATLNADLDELVDDLIEEEHLDQSISAGRHIPMLACRRIDFSYGQVQVLFGVDFTVEEGQMVALLGTNAAGKSTLLRVISGLGLPARGSVRYEGVPITHVDAERRLKLGISQVPGGHGVFGELSVTDNLRAFGFTLGRHRAAIESRICTAFDAFPQLAERRNQMAGTLSGGEQQMLALASAFITRPRLLLIDELSLGLAPLIVSQLLDMVREINRQGTAVVLVEQSVNLALTVADHAYFMEKGEIRFDGHAEALLERPGLLRSVFLAGAATRLGSDADRSHGGDQMSPP